MVPVLASAGTCRCVQAQARREQPAVAHGFGIAAPEAAHAAALVVPRAAT